MIARLRGTLLEADFNTCVVDVNGVGYEVLIPVSTFEQFPEPGKEVTLFIHTQVREDAITLFGFHSLPEKRLFQLLITVNMIGGKVALGVLSAMPVGNFCKAVTQGDLKMLGRIPGVGKRTAERLVVELRDKLDTFLTGENGRAVETPGMPSKVTQAIADALSALEQLGFKREVVEPELIQLAAGLPLDECSSENLLRRALVLINQKR